MALYMYQAAYVGDSGQLNSKILRTELSQSVAPCAKLSVANW